MRARSTDEKATRLVPADLLMKGIHDARLLPDSSFEALWDAIIVDGNLKERLLSQAIVNFTVRHMLDRASLPLHGVILIVGPPGTGKTSLARGLASRTASSLKGSRGFKYLEVDPHALASAALGKSQQAVKHLLGSVVAEQASSAPVIVVLDEVETLAADRVKLSLEANPVDVHRATDAVLAQLDQLAEAYPELLFIATSNFPQAVDAAFVSRADLVATVGLPSPEACLAILTHSLEALASKFPEIKTLVGHKLIKQCAQECVGLDGRRIRKSVLNALAVDKIVALQPAKLTADHVLLAVRQARKELGLDEVRP